MQKQNTEKMKTIFISIFQGVEAKNILRTAILDTLLKNERVRVVLFTGSKERVDYYKKEFQNDRLIYEVVEVAPASRTDVLFSKLKFTLLKTGTTDLLRRISRESGRSLITHWISKMLNSLLARPSVRKTFRYIDFLLIREHTYAKYFDIYTPDLVFLAYLFEEKEIHLLREAKRRQVKSIGLINSWDQVTSRCTLRLLPDKFIVYNNIVKQELVELNDVHPKDIYVGGIAQYDEYATHKPKSRDLFFQDIRADQKKKLMVYASMGKAFSSSEWMIIDVLHGLNACGAFGEDMQILVRFQPNDFVDREELELRPHLLYDYPGTRFTKTRGVDWDMSKKEIQHLADTLHHADLMVSYASSISIDAALFDTPIININFTTEKIELFRGSPMQFYLQYHLIDHYMKAVATGAISVVQTVADFCVQVRKYLDDPALDRSKRRKLVETQCVYTDGKSGERIGRFLLQNL